MKNKIITTLTAIILFAISASQLQAQALKVPAPSPLQTLKQNFGLSEITIEYSRPSVKGRVVFGDLVPFSKMWRTGANQATKITFGEEVKVQGTTVAAGTYALYTIPEKASWTVMLYKDLTMGGNVDEYKAENEVLRFNVNATALANKVETFTINIADMTSKTANVELCWENTRVAFGVSVEIDAKVMKNIETTMSTDARPYHSAANYYYENDKDLTKALEWADKAFQNNPKAYWSAHLKAKIQVKLKDYKGAIATAKQSMALAVEDKNDEYVKMNQKLIDEAGKNK